MDRREDRHRIRKEFLRAAVDGLDLIPLPAAPPIWLRRLRLSLHSLQDHLRVMPAPRQVIEYRGPPFPRCLHHHIADTQYPLDQ